MFKEATMIRSLYTVPAMFCLAAAVVTAQAPADRPANPPAGQEPAAKQPAAPRPAESSTSAGKVTYTGCVKPGTMADTWILENAEAAAKPGASPSTVGTSGTAKMTLNLDPAATVNLKPHANHKVEVVGTLSPAKAGADASASSPSASGAARQQFSVESLKMVSATCP
jgi:hypothetical protein